MGDDSEFVSEDEYAGKDMYNFENLDVSDLDELSEDWEASVKDPYTDDDKSDGPVIPEELLGPKPKVEALAEEKLASGIGKVSINQTVARQRKKGGGSHVEASLRTEASTKTITTQGGTTATSAITKWGVEKMPETVGSGKQQRVTG